MTSRPSPGETQHNVDTGIIEHFGHDWSRFSQQDGWEGDSLREVFDSYFEPLPAGVVRPEAVACDFGAGSGRWAMFVAPLVSHLYVLEPSTRAIEVARENLSDRENITFINEPIGGPSTPADLDFAYALGVLHYIPDPVQALTEIRASLKPQGYFVGYLFYALDNRPSWYRTLWKMADAARRAVTRLPERGKRVVSDAVAAFIYWPIARIARLLRSRGVDTSRVPLNQYAEKSFYVMRNDAMGRLGAPFEHRFSRSDIVDLVTKAGFDPSTLVFSDHEPYWRFAVRNSGS